MQVRILPSPLKINNMEKTKTLNFDAKGITCVASTAYYTSLEVETGYPDEVLANFNVTEIIENYNNLDQLYEALKEHYGENEN